MTLTIKPRTVMKMTGLKTTPFTVRRRIHGIYRETLRKEKNGEKVGQNQHVTPGKNNINEKKFVILCTNLAVVL